MVPSRPSCRLDVARDVCIILTAFPSPFFFSPFRLSFVLTSLSARYIVASALPDSVRLTTFSLELSNLARNERREGDGTVTGCAHAKVSKWDGRPRIYIFMTRESERRALPGARRTLFPMKIIDARRLLERLLLEVTKLDRVGIFLLPFVCFFLFFFILIAY